MLEKWSLSPVLDLDFRTRAGLICLPRSSEQLTVGAQAQKGRFTDDVERFLSSIQFENREKMDELGLDF